jgi:hypothetical protein
MKKLISMILALVMIAALSVPVFAEETGKVPEVRVNGYLVDFPDQKPYIDTNKRTLIPVRFVAESLGADVSWDKTQRAAIIVKDGTRLTIPIGSKDMTVQKNGRSTTTTMDTEAVLINNARTMVPIRFVAEALGAWVSYASGFSTVQIYDDVLTPDEIDALHAVALTSMKTDTRTQDSSLASLFSGTYRIENQNEYALRNYVSNANLNGALVKNPYDGTSWTVGGDVQDEHSLVARFIRSDMAAEFTKAGDGVTAVYRTDESCMLANAVDADGFTYQNYGYLTLTFANNANMAEWKQYHSYYSKLGDLQAGHTYTFTLEAFYWVNLAREVPTCSYFGFWKDGACTNLLV